MYICFCPFYTHYSTVSFTSEFISILTGPLIENIVGKTHKKYLLSSIPKNLHMISKAKPQLSFCEQISDFDHPPPCITRLASRQAGATQCTRRHGYITFDLLMGLPSIGMLRYQYLMDVTNILHSLPWSSTRVTNIWPNRTWSLTGSYRLFIVLFTVLLSVFAHLYRISTTHSFTNYQCAPLNQV